MRSRWLLPLAVFAAGLLARPTAAADVSITPGKDVIEFKAGGEVVAKYQYAGTVTDEKAGGQKPLAKPFMWPVLAPGGTPVTRTWPIKLDAPGDATKDHPHQKSLWFCHGDVMPVGIELKTKSTYKGVQGVDFWDENPGHGVIACVKVGEPKQIAKDHAAITTWNEWKTPDGVKIMDEERTIHLHDLPAGRLFTFDCKLTASVCPITFLDTKEGAFGVRVHDAMRTQLPTGGTVTAPGGVAVKAPAKGNLPVWGKPADWNDYSGTVDGKAVGIAVFDDPKNKYRAAWHTRDYGLMAANPFGRGESGFPSQKGKTDLVKMAKGDTLDFRYGVYAHTGDAAVGKVAEAFETFKDQK